MFLKQIKLQGFKSFANKTVINFDSDYTGIVGPNGCGKSNVIDAIRWVLGEQSPKNMRGSSMSDVVFAGSQGKKGVNLAEVSLVIDNSKHLLDTDYEELEITRRLYKDTNESQYLINNTPCRLKDITDMTLDSGLGKDSLSIISQGTIQTFAEAKPQDRRALFEEAAGVAKYKKKKNESLSKLEKTQENLERLNDIVQELEKQVSPLKRQARKAKEFLEKKNRLTEIEVAVIVGNINNINADLESLEQQLFDLEYRETASKASIQIMDNDSTLLKEEANNIDNEVQRLQDELLQVLNEVQNLEKRKVEVEEKRRYLKESGTTSERIEETKKLLDSAYAEYQDRLTRSDALTAAVELLNENIEQYNQKISDLQQEISDKNNLYNQMTNRRSILENLINSPFESQQGVKTVIKNRNVLPGIHDALTNLIIPDEGYQQMVSMALGGALYNIVTKDPESARGAIKFLKENKAGTATFLPLNVMRARTVQKDHLFICEHTEGFLGLASDFVDCNEEYDVIVLSLLGNVLVTDNLEHGNDLAKRLNYQYKIVTLDGDIIYRGGTMQGGYNRKSDSPLTYQAQLNDINNRIADLQLKSESLLAENSKLFKLREETMQQITSQKVSLASLKELVEIKRSKYEKLKEEYDRIKPDGETESTDYVDEVTLSLNKAYARKDEITALISQKRERRIAANNEYQRKYQQLKQLRNELSEIIAENNKMQIEKAKLLTNRDNQLERLARDYAMTFEYASSLKFDVDYASATEEVMTLRQEIAALGNVNLDAPQTYEEVNERYQFLCKQMDDLTDAREKLLAVINEMDEVMTSQFTEMFGKINSCLAEVFSVLFGGGKARLFLEDKDDILNSGIDIDVQPPGKSVQNIRLFSGGEKSLIAICVLFAILKARPVPLCIFDEVEASLDQGNVDRFARYIHQFSEDTQFIVITHRPGTMTECDVLYGITMQQKGVSSVLKVKLKEALDYIEEDDKNEE